MMFSSADCRDRSRELALSASLLGLILVAPACQTSGLIADTDAGSVVDTVPRADAQCRAVNEACSSWSDCCSGLCGQGSCLSPGDIGGSGGANGSGRGGTTMDASSQMGGAGGAQSGVDAGENPPWRPSTCDEPELGQIPNTDPSTVAKLVVGKWFDCGPLSIFPNSSDIGVEIVGDGTWYKLYWTGTDVVRGVGFGKLGTWTVGSGGICCSVELAVQGAGGGIAFFPAFATSPRKMQVDTSAGSQATLATGEN
jgi:hypothetical protein